MFRRVSMEQGERRAKELGVLFIESSAKTGHNVKQVSDNVLLRQDNFYLESRKKVIDMFKICSVSVIVILRIIAARRNKLPGVQSGRYLVFHERIL